VGWTYWANYLTGLGQITSGFTRGNKLTDCVKDGDPGSDGQCKQGKPPLLRRLFQFRDPRGQLVDGFLLGLLRGVNSGQRLAGLILPAI
jgi:hypothetical protein